MEIFLSINGGEERRFAKSGRQSLEAPWISPRAQQESRMRPAGSKDKLLASLKVTASRE